MFPNRPHPVAHVADVSSPDYSAMVSGLQIAVTVLATVRFLIVKDQLCTPIYSNAVFDDIEGNYLNKPHSSGFVCNPRQTIRIKS